MDARQLLVDSGKRLLETKLTIETWGNLSLRDPDSGEIYISPSAMDYRQMKKEDIIVLRPDGSLLEGKRKPSIETGLHLEVYARRPDVNAILHTHPMASMVFACAGEAIPVISDEAAQTLGAPVPVCPYALPGSRELAQCCAETLGTGMACLLQSHGALCVGKNMDAAFKTAAVLEATAELYWRIRTMGAAPLPISQKNIACMWDFAQNRYGQEKQ